MIFPILRGLFSFSFKRAPITWCLVFLNVLIMSASSIFDFPESQSFKALTEDKTFIEIQGAIYQSYLRAKIDHKVKRELASTVENESRNNRLILGQLAWRDQAFLESRIDDSQFVDEVAFRYWREKMNKFLVDRSSSFSHLLGVSTYSYSPLAWISYMFTHGSWTHLASNLIFLILIGAALELQLGGLGLLIIYLFSGFIGCGIFILFSGLSASPLVGASGAVSGLITAFAVLNWKSPVRFFYWLIVPQRKTIGIVYLPGAFIFYLWIVADMAGFLASTSITGGVAHSAHLGGHLAGFLAAVALLVISKRSSTNFDEPKEMYKLEPLLPEPAPVKSL